MQVHPRGRPKGSVGRSIPLTTDQIKAVFRVARRERYRHRAELLLALSIELGLLATELAALKWEDLFTQEGVVRRIIALRAAHGCNKSHFDLAMSPRVRSKLADYYERQQPFLSCRSKSPIFRSQSGNAMTTIVIARYLTGLYRKAGFPKATSRSGRRTRERFAQERIAGHRSVAI